MNSFCEYCETNFNTDINLMCLPCGYYVCNDHLNPLPEVFDCIICEQHQVNKTTLNEMMRNRHKQIQIKCNQMITRLNELNNQIENFKDKIQNLLQEQKEKIINKIDIRREKLFLEVNKKINDYSNHLIQQTEIFYDSRAKDLLTNALDAFKNTTIPARNTTRLSTKQNILFHAQHLEALEKCQNIYEKFENLMKEIKKGDFLSEKLEISPNRMLGQLELKPITRPIMPDFSNLEEKYFIKLYDKIINSLTKLDSNSYITSSQDKVIKIFDFRTKQVSTLTGHQNVVNCVILYKLEAIISGSDDCTIVFWDKSTYEKLESLTFKLPVKCLSLWNNVLIIGLGNGDIKLYEILDKKKIFTFRAHKNEINGLKLILGDKLLSTSKEKNILLWDLNLNSLEFIFKSDSNVSSIEILNDSEFLTGHKNGLINIWDLNSKNISKSFLEDRHHIIGFLVFDDNQFASYSYDCYLRIWDKNEDQSIHRFKRKRMITSMLVSETGQLIVGDEQGFLDFY